MSNDWIGRTTAHAALTHFVDFMVDEEDHKKCKAIRIKDTGEIIYDGDERIKRILGDSFDTLQDACFYDFSEDIKDNVNE